MSINPVAFDSAKIDAVFSDVDRGHGPGAAVGIAMGGQIVYRKGFGLATMELPIVLSPSIRLRIASFSKHFTCLAYMLLCEEERAAIDDPIRKYLPELRSVCDGVTVRQLMGHTSGLRDIHDIVWQFSGTGRTVSSADLISLYSDIDDVSASPGTTWNYNNGAYLLLSTAIERIAGQPLEEVFETRIFSIVGMRDTILRRSDIGFVANSATLHMTDLKGRFEKSYLGSELAGEAGVVSTVDDMLRWLAQMNNPAVGNLATWETMLTPQILENGTSTDYGLGLFIGEYRGMKTISHAGGLMGCNSFMLKIPGAAFDIVIMTNRHDVGCVDLAAKIVDVCLFDQREAEMTPRFSIESRTFHSHLSGRTIQLYEAAGRQLMSIDGSEIAVERTSDGALIPVDAFRSAKQRVEFLGSNQRPSSIRFFDFGNVEELISIESVDNLAPIAIEGKYESESTGTVIESFSYGDALYMTATGRFGSTKFMLKCLAKDIWQAKSTTAMPWGGVLTLSNDGRSFELSTARNPRLVFRQMK
jgi:D-aminopeptidase